MTFILLILDLYTTLEYKFNENLLKIYHSLFKPTDNHQYVVYDQFSSLIRKILPDKKKDEIDSYWKELCDYKVTGFSQVNYGKLLNLIYKYPEFRMYFRKTFIPIN